MKKLLAIFALLIGSAFVLADVKILPENRIKNYPSGCCMWAALENLGKVHGVKRMDGLAKKRHDRSEELVQAEVLAMDQWGNFVKIMVWQKRGDAPGNEQRAIEELNLLKVNYKLQNTGNKDMKLIEECMKKDLGCMIGVINYPKTGDMHAVTLTAFNEKTVQFIDNNGGCLEYEASREWFAEHWTGFTVVIYPDSSNPVK